MFNEASKDYPPKPTSLSSSTNFSSLNQIQRSFRIFKSALKFLCNYTVGLRAITEFFILVKAAKRCESHYYHDYYFYFPLIILPSHLRNKNPQSKVGFSFGNYLFFIFLSCYYTRLFSSLYFVFFHSLFAINNFLNADCD